MRRELLIIKQNLIWTLKLYSLVFIIPIVSIVLSVIGGFNTISIALNLWLDFFVTGDLGNISAWWIHLVFLFTIFVVLMLSERTRKKINFHNKLIIKKGDSIKVLNK